MRLYYKLFFTLIAALLGVGLIIYQQGQMRRGVEENERIGSELQALRIGLVHLQHRVLEANYFLYYNNDTIYQEMKKLKKILQKLLNDLSTQRKHHRKSLPEIRRLSQNITMLSDALDRFLTINASLKNSSIYLPTFTLKAYKVFDIDNPGEREIILMLSKINTALFLTKNAFDDSFIEELTNDAKSLKSLASAIHAETKKRLIETVMRHLQLFIRFYPLFSQELREILDPSYEQSLSNIYRDFVAGATAQMEEINRIGELLLLLYLATLGVVLYFVFHSEKECLRLKKIREQLEKTLVTDPLTGLGNRMAFVRQAHKMKKPSLIIVNIDRFKHINEFYGTKIGDHLLQLVAHVLERAVPDRYAPYFYRLGGDDFGVLFECDDREKVVTLIEKILECFEKEYFMIDNLSLEISISIGASMAPKLFETADMALKSVKSSPSRRFAIYDESLDVSQKIAANIHALRRLKTALAKDAVVPYFQPIIEVRTGKITKYEALARLDVGHGEVITPANFIEVAKQAKLSSLVTARILEKTLDVA